MTEESQPAPTDWRSLCEKNEDGEWIKERHVSGWGDTTRTVEVNMTKLLERAGPRKTANEFILRVEHENLMDGKEVGNPAEPTTGTAIPGAVREEIRELETVGQANEFIERELNRGPRRYVISIANERKMELEDHK